MLLSGTAPTAGQAAELEREAFPADPTIALDGPVREVEYSSPVGEFPAWFAPGDDTTWAILLHGQRASREEVFRAMRTTTSVGMPSLAITYRNDEGTPKDPSQVYGFGSTEWPDLEDAVRYATDHGADKVVLVGYSMGGAIIAAFLEKSALAEDVAAVVFDAPMLDLGATISHQAADRSLPLVGVALPPPLTWTAKQIAGVRFDLDWDELDYLDDSDWLTVPILIFHGGDDPTNPL
ncbi:MAG: alpha/beta fold hydrolase, partial [Acidothermales bacterium]|nr:alpha/beta fold hydrolase [Acidothermales bacterium]